ncbi:hypothetical protein ACXEHT_004906 [Klebsiella variicola]
MPQISVSSIQRKAVITMRSSTVIDVLIAQLYAAQLADDINAAVTEFAGHPTLSDEDICGDNFNAIAAAFADQSGEVAKALAE